MFPPDLKSASSERGRHPVRDERQCFPMEGVRGAMGRQGRSAVAVARDRRWYLCLAASASRAAESLLGAEGVFE